MRPTGPTPTWPDTPPPGSGRRQRLLMPLLAGGATFVLAAVGGGLGYLLMSGDEAPKPAPTPTSTASTDFFAADWPDITALPDPCASVAQGTLAQIVPGAQANRRYSTGGGYHETRSCSWFMYTGTSRSLGVHLNLRRTEGARNGAQEIAGGMATRWRRFNAEKRSTADPNTKAITAKRLDGIGSEAIYQYKLTRSSRLGESAGIEVIARVRNVQIVVSLRGSDNPSTDPLDVSEQKGIDEATATRNALQVVRELVPRVVSQAQSPASSRPAATATP